MQISTQLIPPHSGYLPDYTSPEAEKLKVILKFNDFTQPQYSVRLRFEIKGNGFTLSTKTFFNPPPINLIPGQPVLLTGSNLANYLDANNLDFVGINQNQYQQKKSLPEGYYSICVKAYDYLGGNTLQVSNEACVNAWFTLSNPPILNTPLCGSNINPQTPQNIVFQWSPQNLGSPNSALNTEYEFMLWESRPDSNANANQLVLSTSPIYSTTTQQTVINYGITEPPLNIYTKYIWRIRAKDITGRDLFKNNGYSQICTFTYGAPQNILGASTAIILKANELNQRTAIATFNKQSIYSTYLLQVRKKDAASWFNYPNTSGSERITNLEPSTHYQCRVRGETPLVGEWSNTAEFTTYPNKTYTCNDNTLPPDGPNATTPLPINKAVTGLVIQSGQFEVVATHILPNGIPGWYKGRGYALIFGAVPVAVKWDNIFIDADQKQQQGIIEALTKGTAAWEHDYDLQQAQEKAIYVDGTIDTLYIANNQICYTFQGTNTPVCTPVPTSVNIVVVRDTEGNEYQIDLNPPPPKIKGPANFLSYSSDSLMANNNLKVEFKASPNQAYGFDSKQYAAFINNYEAIKLSDGKNYFVPNKSITQNNTDEVIATYTIQNFNATLLQFKTLSGALLTATPSVNNSYKISGIPSNAGSIYAWYNNKKIGKLNVSELSSLQKQLVIVPVNSSPANISTQQLNKIYAQAGVTWSVTIAPSFTFDIGSNGLEAADAGLLTKYSPQMRQLRNAYIKQDSLYNRNAYYVFVIPAFSNAQLKGYMVRGRAMGFIKAGNEQEMTWTIAHELAHGAFGLEHTFPKIEKATSNNLLDYNNGTQTVKEQWDLMQSGNFEANWLDEEEDASYTGPVNTASDLFYWLNKIKIAYKNSTQLSIGKNQYIYGSVQNTYLSGVNYEYIYIYFKNSPIPYNINVNGKVNTGITYHYSPSGISSIKKDGISCIDIDSGKVVIIVPENRISNMLYYIKNTQTFKNLILFVNGYRPIVNGDGDETTGLEYANSNNKIEFGDTRGYWKGIDAQFINRIGTRNAIYADGHHSVGTSNHKSVGVYLSGQLASEYKRSQCEHSYDLLPSCTVINDIYLHTTPNQSGFNIRKYNGAQAANDLINKINSGAILFDKQNDTLDIVAHSMGYAYAVGMVETLKLAGIKFGRFYALAPENAISGGADWKLFNEVWQYGSNEIQTKAYLQDGVAPQVECLNLLGSNNTINYYGKAIRSGRVYIPESFTPKGYLESHQIINYGWIFTNQAKGMLGYVAPRN